VEIHEDWIEAHRDLNMEALRDQRKADRQLAAVAAARKRKSHLLYSLLYNSHPV